MRGRFRALASALVLAALTLTASQSKAEAPPSRWEAIADPQLRTDWKIHVTVQQKLVSRSLEGGGAMGQFDLDSARVLLEDARAAERTSPLLRFDLAEVYRALSLYVRAGAVFKRAIEDAPDDPSASLARLDLAFCYSYLERAKDERDSYVEYLRTAPPGHSRTVALMNLAESEMRLGNLREAIAGYRVALESSNELGPIDRETQLLSVWGLAVALDRSGDTKGAMREASLAVALDPGLMVIAHGENVYFVPSYERSYYIGLGWLAEARRAVAPEDRSAALAAAERAWSDYVRSAVPGDRWLPQATRHLAETKAARKVDARAVKRGASGGGPLDPEAP